MPKSIRSWVASALVAHRTGWLCCILALALAAPSIADGFSSDDDILLPRLEGHPREAAPWYDLYYFAGRSLGQDVEAGILPWWSAPRLRLHLVRPLPSALLAADHAIFGRAAIGYHLHSLVWLAGLLVLARSLFFRILDRATATVALFIFALSPNFTLAARLIAARHILVTATMVAAGLVLLVEREGWPWRRWWAGTAFTLALLAGEGGLAGLAFWAMYEISGPSRSSWQARMRKAAVPMLLGGAYLVIYAAVEGGAREMDLYVDPIDDPIGFAKTLVLRLPMLLGNVVWLIDAGLGVFFPVPIFLLGVAGTLLIAWTFTRTAASVPSSDKAALQWLVPGALLATVGVGGGMPGGRELVIPSLGFAPLLATVLLRGWGIVNGAADRTQWARRTFVVVLGVLNVALAPIATLATWSIVRQSAQATVRTARQMRDAAGGARHVVLLTGSDPAVWIYALRLARNDNAGPASDGCWWVASAAKADHRLEPIGRGSFTLETLGTTFLSGDTERMYRAKRVRFDPGAEISQCGSVIHVAFVVDGRPARVEVVLAAPFDDADVAVLAWRNGRIERLSTAEIASGVTIPWSPGPLGLL